MKVAITGASGLIGGALAQSLESDGHRVLRLVRRQPRGPAEARWEPGGRVETAALEGADAVVHLAGAGIGDRRWNRAYKQLIRDSRVNGTRTIAAALAGLADRPKVLVCGSAIGYYGDTGDREADEDSPQGAGFLAQLVADWEAATQPAADAGIRVVLPRTGVVLSRRGGMLARLLPLFRLGLGGRLGSGRQWMSWISLTDQVAALRFLIEGRLSGPVNLTAPHPVTNAEYTRALAEAVRRPAPWVVPKLPLKIALGGFAEEGVFVSQRVMPRRLLEAGFSFTHPVLSEALRAELSGP
ncbi:MULTISPECIES: TIGR01777 family oxidoreductase [Thermomonospora]|uniref:NAD-dependent epimerase/dehydratase n=1 Tax=Thermomonospora curvata (strain ATCC 19995 / DSM 43183 / JCM 3096 / KCTC 9072 / NBRC 15933 / NCIMB 10081 / Henssen B9) TaxID=471852 RepID=D1A8Z8_THECD|nr:MULTISPECIES: TIGR01777 family oxidoreductase [Thermomonospora]ACY98636.1 NAD-dependent epimerase/dehydratase [Thermomonospora curvata DSM 43183]PKK13764.1 MAG: TIGR01777 family protein [Thermomonospora sp. CIF 1]